MSAEEAAKEAKRAEIAARVAAAQAERQKAETLKAFQEAKKQEIEEKGTSYYGEHQGITCDACAVVPIFGYRYACKSCASHDVCESCYDAWAGGTGVMPNKLAKQTLSTNPVDHSFKLYKDQTFKPVVKSTGGPSVKSAPKLKPNDNCACGSGKKYKKCCMNSK
ncbi:secA [Symbiodinium natans]|uniref:SecA protein n=1 Tax=Symbiodinium natans TaxID=878477 RepID=A0A812KLJ9_9DINO|nr:secA [Symbiodinium natans]